MIIETNLIQVRRHSELEFNYSLDISELGFTTDSARLIIGADPNVGDPNYNRSFFPYKNIEVLTEASPRNAQLFNQFMRDQNEFDFFVSVILSPNYSGPLPYEYYDGDLNEPMRFSGPVVSGTVEYHSFLINTSPLYYYPAKSGTLRVLGDRFGSFLTDNQSIIHQGIPNPLIFSIGVESFDEYGNSYFPIFVKNTLNQPIILFSRKVAVLAPRIAAASYSVGTIAGVGAAVAYTSFGGGGPVWVSPPAGSLGTYSENTYQQIYLLAVSPIHLSISYELESGTLPPGLGVVGNAISGTIGTISNSTTYSFTLRALDTLSNFADRSFSMDVNVTNAVIYFPPVWVTPAGNLGTGTEGFSFSFQLHATDPQSFPLTYTMNSGALPGGTNLSSTGLISGNLSTVSNTTTYSFTVNVSDGQFTVPRTFNIIVDVNQIPPVWITPAGNIGSGLVSNSFTYQLQATDPQSFPLTYSVTSGSLPTVLNMNSGGFISGTLTTYTNTTTVPFTVSVNDGVFSVPRSFNIIVNVYHPPVWVTPSGSIGTGKDGNPFSYQLHATDPQSFPLTYTHNSGTFPGSVSVNSSGLVSGTLPILGSQTVYPFTINVSDGYFTVPRPFSITVDLPPVWVTPAGSIGSGPEASFYSFQLQATDPQSLPLTYSLTSGSLPSGVTMSSSGFISGSFPSPITTTTYTFTVTVSDGISGVPRTFSITVDVVNPPVWVTAAGSIGSGEQNTPFSYQLHATDPQSLPLTYSFVSGTFPSGITMNSSGLISGTLPTLSVPATYSFTVNVSDGFYIVPRIFSITVDLPPVWVTPAGSIGSGTGGNSYSFQLQATDPQSLPLTYTLTSGGFPSGITMNSSGLISGVLGSSLPTTWSNIVGVIGDNYATTNTLASSTTTYTFTVTVSDGFASVPRTFSLTVVNGINAPATISISWTISSPGGLFYFVINGSAYVTGAFGTSHAINIGDSLAFGVQNVSQNANINGTITVTDVTHSITLQTIAFTVPFVS